MKSHILPAVIISLIASASHAAIIVDFDASLPSVPTFFSEDGFRFFAINSGTGQNHFDLNDFAASGDQALSLHGNNNSEEVFVDMNGGIFDLNRVDIEELLAPTNVWEIVSSSGTIQSLGPLGTQSFGAGFQSITSFTLRATTIPHLSDSRITLDNFVFNDTQAIPEPSTYTIWSILGLVFLGAARRRSLARQ